jgi:hypothetical protein
VRWGCSHRRSAAYDIFLERTPRPFFYARFPSNAVLTFTRFVYFLYISLATCGWRLFSHWIAGNF